MPFPNNSLINVQITVAHFPALFSATKTHACQSGFSRETEPMGEIQTNRKNLSQKLAQAVTKGKKSPNLPHASRRARSFDVQGLEKTDAQLKEREDSPPSPLHSMQALDRLDGAHWLLYSVC